MRVGFHASVLSLLLGGFSSALPGSQTPKTKSPESTSRKTPSLGEASRLNQEAVEKMGQGIDFEGAKRQFTLAARWFEELHRKDLAAVVRGNLARLFAVHGKNKQALLQFKTLLGQEDLPLMSRCEALLTLAEIHRRLGDPEKALSSMDKALPLLEKTARPLRIRRVRLSRILLLREAGKQSQALSSLTDFLGRVGGIQNLNLPERALLIPVLGIRFAGYSISKLRSLARELAKQGQVGIAASLYFLAFDKNLHRRAFAEAQQDLSLARLRAVESHSKELKNLVRLKEAALLLAQGKTEGFHSLLAPLLKASPPGTQWASAQILCAGADRKEGNFLSAGLGFKKVGTFFQARRQFPFALRTFAQASLAFFKAGKTEEARKLAAKVDELLPLARKKARNPGLVPHTNALLEALYNSWIRSLLHSKTIDSKVDPKAEAKAFLLADKKRQGTLIADALSGLPSKRKRNLLLTLLGKEKNNLAHKKLNLLSRDLSGPRPNYHFPSSTASALQKKLGHGQALLSIFLDPIQPRVWLLDHNGLYSHRPLDPNLKKRIHLWLRLISSYPGKGSGRSLRALQALIAKELLGPLREKFKTIQTLLVVSDPQGGALPIAPLMAQLQEDQKESPALPAIRHLPCAAILLLPSQIQNTKSHGRKIGWLVTHPDFTPLDSLRDCLTTSFSSLRCIEGKLPPLPRNPLKLLYIGAHGREFGKDAALDLGTQILHRKDFNGPAPNLVHLAACSSLRGQSSAFSMQEGFAKDFLSRGSRFVLGARWEVDEISVLAFDKAFYRAWPKVSAPVAFQQAIRSLRNRKQTANPFHWGAFVLYSRN
jgi:tetratricopeptide (TPR) repeat protein